MRSNKELAVGLALASDSMLDAVQLDFLWDLAIQAPDGAACEVGVYRGGTTLALLSARHGRGSFYAVDNWMLNKDGLFSRHAFVTTTIEQGHKLALLECESAEAPARLAEPLAFCFIDAQHGIGGITRDIEVWPGTIMPGGTLAFHDYFPGPRKPTVVVKAIVDAWQHLAQWEELGVVGSTIAFRRPS